MSVSFTRKYEQEFPLDQITSKQFLVLALEAIKKLGWNIANTSENGLTAFTKFSLSSYGEEVNVNIVGSQAILKSECRSNQLLDWGKNKKNIELLITTIGEVKTTLSNEILDQKLEEFNSTIISEQQAAANQSALTPRAKINSYSAIFIPTNGYYITPILINLNIAVFILMVISGVSIMQPDAESLISWGANFRPFTLEGGWWRLITCSFLHIGVFHLLMNMYALLYIGVLLEPYLGKTKFLAAYLLTGVTASIASLWWHNLTVSAGASGSIFGMYGLFLAMLTTNHIEKNVRKSLLTSIIFFVLYNLLNGFKGGIDNAAHIGGLLGGIVIGYAFYPSIKNPSSSKLTYSAIALVSAIVILTSSLIYLNIPIQSQAQYKKSNRLDSEDPSISDNYILEKGIPKEILLYNKKDSGLYDIKTYNNKMTEFRSMEAMALEFYHLPRGTTKDQLLYNIKDRGIYYWNENVNLIEDLEKLNLPNEVHQRNQKLIKYCNLRIKLDRLLYQAVDENSKAYNEMVNYYNLEIGTFINSLKSTEK